MWKLEWGRGGCSQGRGWPPLHSDHRDRIHQELAVCVFLTFNSKKENSLFTGESTINWNKADINSNFQVKGQASIVNDKDLHNQVQLEVVHATRTVGIDAILHKTSNTKRSKFIVTWDKDNSKKAGFDLHQDNNKYSTKVVTPTRSIEIINEYDDSAPVVWSENTLYWDADMDTDKKAGIRLTCSSGERNNDHKIDIKLPTFNKVQLIQVIKSLAFF